MTLADPLSPATCSSSTGPSDARVQGDRERGSSRRTGPCERFVSCEATLEGRLKRYGGLLEDELFGAQRQDDVQWRRGIFGSCHDGVRDVTRQPVPVFQRPSAFAP